jgi:hypothetical protein
MRQILPQKNAGRTETETNEDRVSQKVRWRKNQERNVPKPGVFFDFLVVIGNFDAKRTFHYERSTVTILTSDERCSI